ncbi:PH domain-containing protein [Actinomadura rupiterrae]|uniref:PH domain-containing protein n=1 Tax=Actinomadura rupiterrae TaxID=559627 RepID=UPI0020A59CBF|nr:PH domain-containing protein [Actinomadura rupiterrae]MCP2340888.1 hypothetical protein [Actinomadura rupiterrae]
MAGSTSVRLSPVTALRFDDDALTIVRPWRRRRIRWDDLAGLIFTRVHTRHTGPIPVQLRLVLKDGAPEPGRFLTEGRPPAPYARGPVLFRTHTLEPDDAGPAQKQIYAELESRGFERPEPFAMRYQPSGCTREEQTLAVAMDVRRREHNTHPVTVNHDGGDEHLIGPVLARLAIRHHATGKPHVQPFHSIFFFEGAEAEANSVAFADAVRQVVPSGWIVTASALPERRS